MRFPRETYFIICALFVPCELCDFLVPMLETTSERNGGEEER